MSAALLVAGANLIGSHMRNKEAKKASARQMAFQKDMSNTSYQRGMEDMKKAGLNPILAGKFGGASTPTGSTYNPENVATNAVNTYQTYQKNQADIANVKANTQKIQAETGLLNRTQGSGIGKTFSFIEDKIKGISSGVNNFINNKNLYEGSAEADVLIEKGFIPHYNPRNKKGYHLVNPKNSKDRIFIPWAKDK